MADDPPSDDPKPLLDYEGFLRVKDLAEVVAHYRAAGVEGFEEVRSPGLFGWFSHVLNSAIDAFDAFVVRFRSKAAQEHHKARVGPAASSVRLVSGRTSLRA